MSDCLGCFHSKTPQKNPLERKSESRRFAKIIWLEVWKVHFHGGRDRRHQSLRAPSITSRGQPGLQSRTALRANSRHLGYMGQHTVCSWPQQPLESQAFVPARKVREIDAKHLKTHGPGGQGVSLLSIYTPRPRCIAQTSWKSGSSSGSSSHVRATCHKTTTPDLSTSRFADEQEP